MRLRTRSAAAAAAAGLLALTTAVAGASAATLPAATLPATSGPPILQPAAGTFVPPKVGPISVDIGRTIINGQIIDPGLHVLMPGVSAPATGGTAR